jgi:hypothetical protein
LFNGPPLKKPTSFYRRFRKRPFVERVVISIFFVVPVLVVLRFRVFREIGVVGAVVTGVLASLVGSLVTEAKWELIYRVKDRFNRSPPE